jgi:hypothetical protein
VVQEQQELLVKEMLVDLDMLDPQVATKELVVVVVLLQLALTAVVVAEDLVELELHLQLQVLQ